MADHERIGLLLGDLDPGHTVAGGLGGTHPPTCSWAVHGRPEERARGPRRSEPLGHPGPPHARRGRSRPIRRHEWAALQRGPLRHLEQANDRPFSSWPARVPTPGRASLRRRSAMVLGLEDHIRRADPGRQLGGVAGTSREDGPNAQSLRGRKTQLRPEGWLSTIRTRALEIVDALNVPGRRKLVEDLVGAVAGTRPIREGAADLLVARAGHREWDPVRLERLRQLSEYLTGIPVRAGVPERLPPPPGDLDGTLPFFEAYFSNFIEGTEFTIDEAERIVRSGDIPPTRPQDAHDILGTYRVVSDPVGRATVPEDAERLITLLRLRHRAIMSGRPEKRPGGFKEERNQAGSYIFVDPELVEGTLIEGFKLGQDLPPGFPRAMYQLFLISEVHPFDDGNGRVARAAMCAELSAAQESRILVPIVFRNEYLTALRVVSRDGRFEVLVRTLGHAWRWTAAMPWHDRSATLGRLTSTNALLDSTDAERSGARLELP
jgi:hypothetical protein